MSEPTVRRLRQGWVVSDHQLLVVAKTRQEALVRYRRLCGSAPDAEAAGRLCDAQGCEQPAAAIFNVAWLCAMHCTRALMELRSMGLARPVEFLGDVATFVEAWETRER